jgi:hypothetical protein
MQLINQLLDYTTPWRLPNIYLFTGNPIIKNNGAIVMGRGAAKQVRDTYRGIDKVFGDMIAHEARDDNYEPNVLFAREGLQYIGWFKVKRHWQMNAELEIIIRSTTELTQYAVKRPEYKFHMNYPGIGNGELRIEDVAPIVATMPDNVLLYHAVNLHHFSPQDK